MKERKRKEESQIVVGSRLTRVPLFTLVEGEDCGRERRWTHTSKQLSEAKMTTTNNNNSSK
jgi:hypothetical protein